MEGPALQNGSYLDLAMIVGATLRGRPSERADTGVCPYMNALLYSRPQSVNKI